MLSVGATVSSFDSYVSNVKGELPTDLGVGCV